MAVTGHSEIEIAATPAEVMDAIADVEALPSWSASHKSVTVEERHEDGRPKRVRSTMNVMGINDEQVAEYTWNGVESVSWSLLESAQQKSQEGKYVLEPTDKGTKAVFDLAVETKIAIPGFIVKKAQKSGVETATKGLKKFVEKS
ncbi:SRPBCC family protein [Tomitella fengzijianii]|uniref:SRPBCC family protein n=1 Tax=Tomitella fengzijianii TaxID=2597660 RepID=A0A516X3K6_9ACTN|nr:SRPBCC family protein [Tomitella fengzijianii]QDQ97655.1 SRPBCC family protein [Tomitella fengzijianii]